MRDAPWIRAVVIEVLYFFAYNWPDGLVCNASAPSLQRVFPACAVSAERLSNVPVMIPVSAECHDVHHVLARPHVLIFP